MQANEEKPFKRKVVYYFLTFFSYPSTHTHTHTHSHTHTHTHTHHRILVRSSDHYVHGVVGVGELVGGEMGRVEKEEMVVALGKEMGLQTCFKPALLPDIQRELLKIDEVG